MRLTRLPRSFYLQPTLQVARNLLGMYICRRLGRETRVGRIVEVEAYLGKRDPASHAFRGKTSRNEVMFSQGGHLYVYFTYGMHFCSNVVTEDEEIGHAVLLRAVEPVAGLEAMRRSRGLRPDETSLSLCNGPAKFCKAFGIGRAENGIDLCGNEIWLAKDMNARSKPGIGISTRVGISNGRHHRWRFYIKGNAFVSPGKPVNS
jgi:DNA-3-methyladenine glycosylase